MNSTPCFWNAFNFIVRRIIASAFFLGGLTIGFVNLPSLLPGGSISVNGVPTNDFIFRLAAVILPLIVSIFGIALFRAKKYFPPNIKEPQ